MNTRQQKLYNAAITAGKTKSYAYRVAKGQHVLEGPTGPRRKYANLDMENIRCRLLRGEGLKSIAANLEIPYRTMARRVREYNEERVQ